MGHYVPKFTSKMNLLLVFLIGFINTSLAVKLLSRSNYELPYTIDVLEFDWNISTPDAFEMEFKITRPSRGVFAISGHAEFKRDIDTDKSKGLVHIYYSANGISYMRTPFHVPMITFTDGINSVYKFYVMETMKECCKNALVFEGKFVSPLSKRRMECENCVLGSENYPDQMRMGYYKISGTAYGDVAYSMSGIVKLERR